MGGGGNCCERRMEGCFEKIGRVAAYHPWKLIFTTLLVVVGFGYGFSMLESETRPEKQWVGRGSPALDHNDYVLEHWPTKLRRNAYIAKCKGDDCNIMEATYLKRLQEMHQKILDIVVDGDEIVKKWDETYPNEEDRVWDVYAGKWSFEGDDADVQRRCYEFGTICWKDTILAVYNEDEKVVEGLTDASALFGMNFWGEQEMTCPVSISTATSPCVNATAWSAGAATDACQDFDYTTEFIPGNPGCNDARQKYCDSVCPDVDDNACADMGCEDPTMTWPFSPFDISSLASGGEDGVGKDANGNIVSAIVFQGSFNLNADDMFYNGVTRDLIGEEWEKQALCILGHTPPIEDGEETAMECEEDDLLELVMQFDRSLGDEFGAAISGDIGGLGSSFMLIIAYMVIMLSMRDPVHSMMGMSIVTVLIVGFSYACAMGLGAYIGLFNNNLNNNIPFLLLGLGVDDAFVLAGEFTRQLKLNPKISNEDAVIKACSSGGISILITSVTDGLAFLIGSATVLPALSWFCQFAGIGVIFCFIFQLTFFLPCLMINARRASANRFDLGCCCKSKIKHDIREPKGCCCCCNCGPDILPNLLGKFIKAATSKIGTIVTIVVFFGISVVGIIGCTKIYKDFKLEWFFPSDSYVNVYFDYQSEYFASGSPVAVYVGKINYYENQDKMVELHDYLSETEYMDPTSDLTDWHASFLAADTTEYTNKEDYYTGVCTFLKSDAGSFLSSNVQWVDTGCETSVDCVTECDPTLGISDTQMRGLLNLEYTNFGNDRYETMTALRDQVTEIFGEDAFPYSFQFLYWEEVGIIDTELSRNLLVCGIVIIVIIMTLIPNPRVSVWVVFSIVLSLVDLVGYLYWWDITISGVSTIYILISVGLAVDYSAHIAHMFAVSTGTARERAIKAITRIGPSVFNAITSTFLAVIALSFSKSYVFVIFFRCLFLVVMLGGMHGLWLMPVLLSMMGGDRAEDEDESDDKNVDAVNIEDGEGVPMTPIEPQKELSKEKESPPRKSTPENNNSVHPAEQKGTAPTV